MTDKAERESEGNMGEIRVGKPGDLCVLLAPDQLERLDLRSKQLSLIDTFGGWIVPEPHITCQRFCLSPGGSLGSVIDAVKRSLTHMPPFQVYASGLTEFLSPFWGTYVLRWQIQEDKAWKNFISRLDHALKLAGCEIHYLHDYPKTCGAVELTQEVDLRVDPNVEFPQPLFVAQKFMITGILGTDDFETLSEMTLFGGQE